MTHLTRANSREVGRAVLTGVVVAMAGTIPRNVLFALNLRIAPGVPWAIPVLALYLLAYWRVLSGHTVVRWYAAEQRENLRANPLTPQQWLWSMSFGVSAIVALILLLHIANRMVMLPQQTLPDFSGIPRATLLSLLLAGAPVAGLVEESAFRGYMQRPIEQRFGLVVAILITGTMFALVHLDFTPILWPYYVAVAAIYGVIASRVDSILPTIALHTLGNTYSTLDLVLHGRAEWQAARTRADLIWSTGVDASFAWLVVGAVLASGIATGVLRNQPGVSRD